MNPKLHTTVALVFWFILMLVSHFFFPIAQLITFPWTFAGVTICAIGIWLNALSTKTLRDRKTTTSYAHKPSHLVVTGPFKFSRNPIYLSTVIQLFGIAMIFGSVTPFLSVLGWWMTLNFLFVPVEETQLEQFFGKAYSDYRQHVRRWL